jgi:hypothetical protein
MQAASLIRLSIQRRPRIAYSVFARRLFQFCAALPAVLASLYTLVYIVSGGLPR